MNTVIRACTLFGVALLGALPIAAQSQTPSQTPPEPPNLLVVFREEVRPGKGAAHTLNEHAWASAFTKGQAPIRWLAMTSLSGPSEAWFLSGYESYAAYQKSEDAMEANAPLQAEGDTFSAQESELLSRTSAIIARYRPALSYQPAVSIPQMRYMQVDVVQVNPGYGGEFTDTWRAIVEAHTKAKMNEHWAVYAVESGLPNGTFLFMYPHKSLNQLDGTQAMHTSNEYRDAVGESGRTRQNQMTRDGITSQQTFLFAFKPRMSLLTKEFIEQDSAFWAPKPVAAPAKKIAEKR